MNIKFNMSKFKLKMNIKIKIYSKIDSKSGNKILKTFKFFSLSLKMSGIQVIITVCWILSPSLVKKKQNFMSQYLFFPYIRFMR